MFWSKNERHSCCISEHCIFVVVLVPEDRKVIGITQQEVTFIFFFYIPSTQVKSPQQFIFVYFRLSIFVLWSCNLVSMFPFSLCHHGMCFPFQAIVPVTYRCILANKTSNAARNNNRKMSWRYEKKRSRWHCFWLCCHQVLALCIDVASICHNIREAES